MLFEAEAVIPETCLYWKWNSVGTCPLKWSPTSLCCNCMKWSLLVYVHQCLLLYYYYCTRQYKILSNNYIIYTCMHDWLILTILALSHCQCVCTVVNFYIHVQCKGHTNVFIVSCNIHSRTKWLTASRKVPCYPKTVSQSK